MHDYREKGLTIITYSRAKSININPKTIKCKSKKLQITKIRIIRGLIKQKQRK